MVILDALNEGNLIIVTTSKEKYNLTMQNLYTEFLNYGKKIGYITINRPYSNVHLKGDVYFVDAITATVQQPPKLNNCIFVSSPTALTELSIAFSSLFGEKGCSLVIFDTISTLIIYQDIGTVIKFTHNLVTKASVLNKKAIFIALKEDSETLIKDLNMFVDKVIDL